MSSSGQRYASPQEGFPPTTSDSPVDFRKLVFTQEELRVLRECSRESFFYRSVPLSGAFATLTFIALRRGIFKTSQRFGYAPKLLSATLVGYLAGKYSYLEACNEKIMKLPNSQLADIVRKNKGMVGFQESLSVEPGFSVAMPSDEPQTLHPRQPSFDDHRPDLHNEGLDDYERGVTDSLSPYTEITPNTPHQSTSYRDLRRQNREEYVNKMVEKYRSPLQDNQGDKLLDNSLSDISPPPPPSRSTPSPRVVRKNQYGDEVYE